VSVEIWCIAEHRDGVLDPDTWQLLGAAKKLGGTAVAVVCAAEPGPLAEQIAPAADRVIALKHEAFADFTPGGYAQAIVSLAGERQPGAILMLHSHFLGRDLGPLIANRLETGLISDCIDLTWEDGLVGWRLVYRRKLVAKQKIAGGTPHVATCQRGAFMPAEAGGSSAEIENLDASIDVDRLGWRVLGFEAAEVGDEDITEAEVIVVGGRGVGDQETFESLRELTQILGGAQAATRPVVDQGWAERGLQIGSSGKTVRPRLYIGLGVSGAIQHVVGMRDSDVIVAVNKDGRAPIFEYADYGIVADLKEILPRLIEQIRELRG
jgi:electron transfer flavoprotein alpha subunit